jgi:hypothetical protein
MDISAKVQVDLMEEKMIGNGKCLFELHEFALYNIRMLNIDEHTSVIGYAELECIHCGKKRIYQRSV